MNTKTPPFALRYLNLIVFYIKFPFLSYKIENWVKRYVSEDLKPEEIKKLRLLFLREKLNKKTLKKEIKNIEENILSKKSIIWNDYLEKRLPKKYTNCNLRISNTPELTAIIIETRKHTHFKVIVQNTITNLQHLNIGLQVYHGTNNENFVKECLKQYENIEYININVGNIDIEGYNKIMLSKTFHENIPTDLFLVFQTDSITFRALDKKFLQFDYIGAPWKKSNHLTYKAEVGNGGLSLRSKTAMLSILNQNIERPKFMPEDLYLAQILKKQNYNIPSYSIASEFSIEEVYNPHAFGCHKCWETITIAQLNTILSF